MAQLGSTLEDTMKQRQKTELWILVAIVVASFFFVPMMNMTYEVIAQKQVTEEYTTIEPYIVQEKVTEPYLYIRDGVLGPNSYETRLRTVTVNVTKYREVTKTRLVTRPVVETQTKRVSILRYLLK